MRDWDFVELLREYILVNQTLNSLFDRLRDGEPCFAEMAELVGDSESSILFRLKERCHAQFRKDPTQARDMHREVPRLGRSTYVFVCRRVPVLSVFPCLRVKLCALDRFNQILTSPLAPHMHANCPQLCPPTHVLCINRLHYVRWPPI